MFLFLKQKVRRTHTHTHCPFSFNSTTKINKTPFLHRHTQKVRERERASAEGFAAAILLICGGGFWGFETQKSREAVVVGEATQEKSEDEDNDKRRGVEEHRGWDLESGGHEIWQESMGSNLLSSRSQVCQTVQGSLVRVARPLHQKGLALPFSLFFFNSDDECYSYKSYGV